MVNPVGKQSNIFKKCKWGALLVYLHFQRLNNLSRIVYVLICINKDLIIIFSVMQRDRVPWHLHVNFTFLTEAGTKLFFSTKQDFLGD